MRRTVVPSAKTPPAPDDAWVPWRRVDSYGVVGRNRQTAERVRTEASFATAMAASCHMRKPRSAWPKGALLGRVEALSTTQRIVPIAESDGTLDAPEVRILRISMGRRKLT